MLGNASTRLAERQEAVKAAVDDIRKIEQDAGVTRESLAAMKERLTELASEKALFPKEDFPAPAPEDDRTSYLYRISEDDDHRFALYVQSALGKVEAPPHNHTTWAVIAGIQGDELNRFYDRTEDGGVAGTGEAVVRDGTAVAFLPDDLHSIHVDATEPVINFHMYGLALEQLDKREYYKADDHEWKIFPPHKDIVEARTL